MPTVAAAVMRSPLSPGGRVGLSVETYAASATIPTMVAAATRDEAPTFTGCGLSSAGLARDCRSASLSSERGAGRTEARIWSAGLGPGPPGAVLRDRFFFAKPCSLTVNGPEKNIGPRDEKHQIGT